MNATAMPLLPKSFWIVAVLALLWNLLGLAMFFAQVTMTPEAVAALSAAQREVYQATPAWINGAYALAVIGGVLGGIGLLLRRRWAMAMFALSLVALLVQVVATYLLTPAWTAMGASSIAFPVMLIIIAAAFLVYARRAAARGWLH